MFARATSLLLILAVLCLPLAAGQAAQARGAQACCAEHSSQPTCPGCPVAPDGNLSCCAGPVVLAPFSLPPTLSALPCAEAAGTRYADRWTTRRDPPGVPPPR